jgi:translation initiation factor IF-3
MNEKKNSTRVNETIRWSPIILIDQDGHNLGATPTRKALDMARQVGLDLVEVAPHARPPVCKIMDYGKFKYEQSKKQKKPKEAETKELFFRPSTDENDVNTKVNAMKKWLISGHRVIVKIKFVRRENAHKDLGFRLIQRVLEDISEVGTPQSPPALNEKNIICTVIPIVKKG